LWSSACYPTKRIDVVTLEHLPSACNGPGREKRADFVVVLAGSCVRKFPPLVRSFEQVATEGLFV
jgi:hypothetical protein